MFSLLDDSGRRFYFEALSVAFGARNAVNAFNTPARALKFLAAKELDLAVTHFFDDFTQLDLCAMADKSASCLLRLMCLMGWQFKDSPEFLKPMDTVFSPLGVVVDLSIEDHLLVGNTVKRVDKLESELSRLGKLDCLPHADLLSILGVTQYMEAQTSGRSGALVMRKIRAAMRAAPALKAAALPGLLCELGQLVAASIPRKILRTRTLPPVLILTDAAADGEVTISGCLLDPFSGALHFFGALVAEVTVASWKADGKKQVIGQAELLASPVAFYVWRVIIRHRDVLAFVDNDSAKACLVRGASLAMHSAEIAHEARLISAEYAVSAWYERVPSPSNIADWPSRRKVSALKKMGFTSSPIELSQRLKALCALSQYA